MVVARYLPEMREWLFHPSEWEPEDVLSTTVKLQALRRLHIRGHKEIIANIWFDAIRAMTTLLYLHVEYVPNFDFTALYPLVRLQELTIRAGNANDEACAVIQRAVPQLRKLSLFRGNVTTNGIKLLAVRGMQYLETLSVNDVSNDEAALSVLFRRPADDTFPNLKLLCLPASRPNPRCRMRPDGTKGKYRFFTRTDALRAAMAEMHRTFEVEYIEAY